MLDSVNTQAQAKNGIQAKTTGKQGKAQNSLTYSKPKPITLYRVKVQAMHPGDPGLAPGQLAREMPFCACSACSAFYVFSVCSALSALNNNIT